MLSRKHQCLRGTMQLVLLATTICCLPVAADPSQKAQKVNYEPKVVTLTGTIVPQTFAGPPNYESVSKGDKAEKEWVLHLQQPIELDAEADNDAEKNVKMIQLVMGYSTNQDADPSAIAKTQYKNWKPLTQKGVTVLATGTLFHSMTGHHHTKVLMNVHELKRKQ